MMKKQPGRDTECATAFHIYVSRVKMNVVV